MVVEQSGMPLQSLLRRKETHKCECISCLAGVPCNISKLVYRAECNECGEEYIGASCRPADKRIGEHEASIRCKNNRTSLGKHWKEHHPSESESNSTQGNRRPRLTKKEKSEALNKAFTFGVVHKGRDNLETFILEGITIKDRSPKINNMNTNGFIF